jgi:uncharacterized protein (DUF58 family)
VVFVAIVALVVLFCFSFVWGAMFALTKLLLFVVVLLVLLDALLLYRLNEGLTARRVVPEKLSNGDANLISIYLENRYGFAIRLEVIDEIPFQFQKRDLLFESQLASGERQILRYELRPTKRGAYEFGAVNVYVISFLGLIKRRFQFSQRAVVPVYPSFLQMREYELMAISNRLTDLGVKKIRRIGQSMEFEQIRPYVRGDDVRTLNWKATARRNDLMVNAFQEEKSQAVYCLIDKGRVMKMPFEGLSLLDYAINASLVLSNIALYKQDKAGIATFSDRFGQLLLADRKPGQLQRILELLYHQKTRYLETDFEQLYLRVRQHVKQRSLLVLFTNFETLAGMRRQLPYFRKLAKDHLLLVIIFENTELKAVLEQTPTNTEEIYRKTIAEKYFYEKQQIVKELGQYGIQAMLTTPQHLTVNTINQYLSLKARNMI